MKNKGFTTIMFVPLQIQTESVTHIPEPFAKVVLFAGQQICVSVNSGTPDLPENNEIISLGIPPEGFLRIGTINGIPCFGAELPSLPDKLPAPLAATTSRAILAEAVPDVKEALCRARELVHWRKQHRFCGSCREKLKTSQHDLAMICPNCGTQYFPQIAPAVIVAVTRNNGRELLLAHNRRFAPGVYSLIAGFIEAGENVEQAVHREIKEETNISVTNLKYLASQPWPFPNSLMLAFSAEYLSGELCPDGNELTDCQWFSRDNLPELPQPGSIARRVIDGFINSPACLNK